MKKPTPADVKKFLTQVREEINKKIEHAEEIVFSTKNSEAYEDYIGGLREALAVIEQKADFWLRGL